LHRKGPPNPDQNQDYPSLVPCLVARSSHFWDAETKLGDCSIPAAEIGERPMSQVYQSRILPAVSSSATARISSARSLATGSGDHPAEARTQDWMAPGRLHHRCIRSRKAGPALRKIWHQQWIRELCEARP